MKVASLGWLFFGLAVIVLIGYGLNRGIYAGSAIDVSAREGEGKLLYSKSCHYLHFDGVHSTIGVEAHSREDVESTSCPPLADSN